MRQMNLRQRMHEVPLRGLETMVLAPYPVFLTSRTFHDIFGPRSNSHASRFAKAKHNDRLQRVTGIGAGRP